MKIKEREGEYNAARFFTMLIKCKSHFIAIGILIRRPRAPGLLSYTRAGAAGKRESESEPV